MRRPHIHFTPQRGWMNDPNGLIYVKGYYHVFYQHYPKDISWGPVHWGHAVSRDLIHWEHKDIALYPNDFGYIFSGSCFLDTKNVTGLGSEDQPALLAFYTAHHPDTGVECQCLAYSLDYESFTQYYNPIIPNPGTEEYKDFRDPKVFAGPKENTYGMVVSCGRKVVFYQSENLLDWEKSGEFDPSAYGFGGICECPDIFPIQMEDKTRMVLSMSMILDEDMVTPEYDLSWKEYRISHVMQYFVGQFDGTSFIDTQVLSEPLIMDYGSDNYAMVSFSNYSKAPEKQLMMGWAQDWDTVEDCPTISGVVKGKLTLARWVTLRCTDAGIRIVQQPVLSGEYRTPKYIAVNDSVAFNPMVPAIYQTVIEDCGIIRLCNGADEEILIDISEDEIHVDCRYASSVQFGLIKEDLARDIHIARRVIKGQCDLTLIYDEGVLEVYADEGTCVFTMNVYPNIPYTQLVVLEK